MGETLITLNENDPLVSHEYGIGVQRGEAGARFVALVLMHRDKPGEPQHIHLGTPEGIRGLAKALIKVANDAEKEMNAAVAAVNSGGLN